MKTAKVLKASAREQLLGHYPTAVITYTIVQFFISACMSIGKSQFSLKSGLSILIYFAIYLIVTLLLAVFQTGENRMYLNLARGNAFQIADLFWAFLGYADQAIFIQLFILLKIVLCGIPFFLCSLIVVLVQGRFFLFLLAVSLVLWGVFAVLISIQYSQVLYILCDNPDLSVRALLQKTKENMYGQKKRYFCLLLSFLGMGFLNVITFSLAAYWIHPYMVATKTNFYLSLQEERKVQKEDTI